MSQENKPSTGEINIRVKDQNGGSLCFKLKKSIKLKKLMDTYCNRNGYPSSSVRFLYEGETIKETDTPETLRMNDNDEIDAMIEQHGGGFWTKNKLNIS